ncbi:hypothetical protein L1987_74349 [Smallanthus sonchifolius]|uniref:Uncharacterized protein n=1 Tax=Smallanthus sonchifolius TaxID=185202 RepID=A0ACB9A2H7_9ASTR|nr:hypothetical protein L1987_74349 [Smallanthus sonchifolius]
MILATVRLNKKLGLHLMFLMSQKPPSSFFDDDPSFHGESPTKFTIWDNHNPWEDELSQDSNYSPFDDEFNQQEINAIKTINARPNLKEYNQDIAARVFVPPTKENALERDIDARPNLKESRSGLPLIQVLNSETDACCVNKEESSILGSNTSSESTDSVRDMGKTADKIGDSLLVSKFLVYSSTENSISARKKNSTGLSDSTGKSGSAGAVPLAVTGDAENFSLLTPKCGEFGHNEDIHKPPPPPPVVEPLVVEPAKVAPQIATNKGKNIMDDGFIEVRKKKKKSKGPKPRVQIPSLNVNKSGLGKPSGRPKPIGDPGPSTKAQNSQVHVSNPFSALDDTTQSDDSFPELNAALKKSAKKFVDTNTIPTPEAFLTWPIALKDYYYSLIKDAQEEVESETDGTARLMSTSVP